jgi:hypothetical protein
MNAAQLRLFVLSGLTLIGVIVFGWQHRVNAALRHDLARLQSQNRGLLELRAENKKLQELPIGEASGDASHEIRAKLIRVRGEVVELEKKLEAARARAVAAANRDPEKGMVRVKYFRNVGRATPAAAFQTMFWAALNGDDNTLAGCFALSAADRQKAVELLAGLPENVRSKSPTPEKLVGLFFAMDTLQRLAAGQVVGQKELDAGHVALRWRTTDLTENTREQDFPMVLGAGGWQLALPDGVIDEFKKMLDDPRRTPGAGAAKTRVEPVRDPATDASTSQANTTGD